MEIKFLSLSGQYLHRDIFEMVAAYIFHISQNHPFIDGNKRTALAAGLARNRRPSHVSRRWRLMTAVRRNAKNYPQRLNENSLIAEIFVINTI